MSRVGKNPVPIPGGVTVQVDGSSVTVKGPKGEMSRTFDPAMTITVESGTVIVTRASDHRQHRALHGLTRALIANMVAGVSQGFRRVLEIVGVGFKAELAGKRLNLVVGFSHPILITPPDGIKFAVENPTHFAVEGISKELVGEVAARIRRFRPPEPYKGKGIRYEKEYVRRKAGKTAA
ncbi:MAG: 50S ribosomal protein L6 [candidate division Zixibacteria bacterium]|nr:50S ribosomal protein L6 [candidate division Zixibacteria bacterium]